MSKHPFKAKDKIRRKQTKNKTRPNPHPIITISEFKTYDSCYHGKNVKSHMVILEYGDGTEGSMSVKGLDWYEKVID